MSGAAEPHAIVQVAMDEEAQPFLDRADTVSDAAAVGASAQRMLTIDGRELLLVRSGIGFVHAASAALAAALAHPGVPLIAAGTAGGLAAAVQVGDVVVGEHYVNVDADVTAFGYALGQLPGMPAVFDADASLLAAAPAGLAALGPSAVRRGTIGSGEAFVTSDRAERLRADFPAALAVDMESAAIAQLAHAHGIRYLSVRAISDLCAPDGTEFAIHVDDAAERSAAVVTALIAAHALA